MTKTELEQLCHGNLQAYPRTAGALLQYLKVGDFMAGSLAHLVEADGIQFWSRTEPFLDLFAQLTNDDYDRRLNALIPYTYEYLKAQVAFTRRGSYAKSSFEQARQEVYDNPDVMQGYYLDGLLLTQVFWPGHVQINDFYRRSFLDKLSSQVRFCEVGVGHGWFFTSLLLACPQSQGVGLDVSQFSLDYTRDLARARGISPDRYQLKLADAQAGLPIEPGTCDAIVCGEVLEHVEKPDELAKHIARGLRSQSLAFFTAPVQSDALDHIYEFHDAQEVKSVIASGGFRIVETLEIGLSDFDPSGRALDPTVLVSVVAMKE